MSQQSLFIADGAGSDNSAQVLNSTPSGTEYGLAVRIIGASAGGTNSLFTQAFPSSGTAAGFNDGTNMQGARVFDSDSGGGTEYVLGTNLRFTSSGGSVEAGTASAPLRIDPTGTTIQPISGTVTANAGTGTFTVSGTVAATQSGTWTVQPGNTANTTPWLTTINEGGNSATVTGANALKVDGSAVTQPVSGTITANIGTTNGLALDATLTKLTIAQGASLGSNTQALIGGSVTTAAPSYSTGQISPLSLTTSGLLRVDGSGVTQPISGTVTANAGSGTFTIAGTVTANQGGTWIVQPGNTQNTTPWLTQDSADGPVAPGAVASKSILLGGQYNTSLPTLTNTQQAAVQVDSNGRLLVGSIASALPTGANVIGAVTQSGGPWTTNQTQINGSAVATLTAGEQKVAVEGLAADGYAKSGNPVLVAGSDGTNVQTVLTDVEGKIVVTIISPTATTGLAQGRVIGASGVQAAIRATTYTEQTANFTGSIKSSNANDTSAGTGARQVTIYYVDSTGASAGTEVVSLNGTTAVNLAVSTKCFIEKMVVTSVGSAGWNLGIITLYTGSAGTGTIVGTIGFATMATARGDNSTFWAHHYVITGKTINIATITAGTNGNQAGIIFLSAAIPTVANSPEQQISDILCMASNSSGIFRGASYPIRVMGPARVTGYVIPSGSNTNYFCGFEYLEQ